MELRCLLVEDDDRIASEITTGLARFGHQVIRTDRASAVLEMAREQRPDAIILDRLLADGDSKAVIRQWREAGMVTPVIMLTVMSALHERIAGLNAGADDYLGKPCEIEELDARLRALARISARQSPAPPLITVGSIELDYLRREVRREGRLIPLQPREFKLLEELAANAGRVVPRRQLLERVWNLRFDPRTKLIETHMSRLRDKLNAGAEGDPIETVRGVGYRLRTDA